MEGDWFLLELLLGEDTTGVAEEAAGVGVVGLRKLYLEFASVGFSLDVEAMEEGPRKEFNILGEKIT